MASTCTTRACSTFCQPTQLALAGPLTTQARVALGLRSNTFASASCTGHDRSSTPSLGSATVRISSSSSPTDRACLVPSPRVALSVPVCRRCTEPLNYDPNKDEIILDGLLYNQNDNNVKNNNVTDVVCNAADAIPHVRSRGSWGDARERLPHESEFLLTQADRSDAEGVREELLEATRGKITIPLMYMKITQGDPAPTCKLPNFTVTRPCCARPRPRPPPPPLLPATITAAVSNCV